MSVCLRIAGYAVAPSKASPNLRALFMESLENHNADSKPFHLFESSRKIAKPRIETGERSGGNPEKFVGKSKKNSEENS
jgi:hypothetical protein